MGTGPSSSSPGSWAATWSWEAFEDYWGGAPAVKRVIFRTIPEALNRTIGLETGEVDLAYDLGITDLDPIHYSLYFERFLNPERVPCRI